MKHSETLMWKEISETPKIFGEIQGVNADVMKNLVADIKSNGATNFVAAARGTSDHALIYFKYMLEVNSKFTVGLSAPSVVTLYKGKNGIYYFSNLAISSMASTSGLVTRRS